MRICRTGISTQLCSCVFWLKTEKVWIFSKSSRMAWIPPILEKFQILLLKASLIECQNQHCILSRTPNNNLSFSLKFYFGLLDPLKSNLANLPSSLEGKSSPSRCLLCTWQPTVVSQSVVGRVSWLSDQWTRWLELYSPNELCRLSSHLEITFYLS